MLKKQQISWVDPLKLAYQISISNYKEDWIFLYSALYKDIRNSKSYLGLFPKKEIISNNFKELERALISEQNRYFGYFGYGLKNDLESKLENLSEEKDSIINLPNLWMINFGLVLEFDCDQKTITKYGDLELDFIDQDSISKTLEPILIGNLNSNFTKNKYLQKVKQIQNHIQNGDIYQANLTRKFFGKFDHKPKNNFEIFLKLNQSSPANYSSFLKLKDNFIISSSPELFLKINPEGEVLSSPIKGTAKKFRNLKLDQKSKIDLQNSPKEQAENLMIVDLVRNDLSKHCLVGSVEVKNLFKITSYKTIHHLSSDVIGVKDKKISNLEIVKDCFPAGSMTGAPKIKAMEICSKLEEQKRGVYSGAIGFIDNQSCELSVVIRTLIINQNQFEFQAGGAITFDSIPQKEWQETINKAKGIAQALGIVMPD